MSLKRSSSGVHASLIRGVSVIFYLATSVIAVAAPQDLDNSFGVGGRVYTQVIGNSDIVELVLPQSDGKILTAGHARMTGSSNYRIAFVRYLADGSLDSGFGSGGTLIPPTDIQVKLDLRSSVALQPDGKILLTGLRGSFGQHLITRYNSDGSLDASFTGPGEATGVRSIPSQICGICDQESGYRVTTLSDGRFMLAQTVGYSVGQLFEDWRFLRYLSDGQLDVSFGTDGELRVDLGNSSDILQGVRAFADGSFAAYGRRLVSGGGYESVLAKFTPSGAIDPGFGSNGLIVEANELSCAVLQGRELLLRPDQNLVFLVEVQKSGGCGHASHTLRIRHYSPTGQSIARLPPVNSLLYQPNLSVTSATMLPGGSFVVANGAFLTRYSELGTHDAKFLNPTTVVGVFPGTVVFDTLTFSSVAADSSGRILAAGSTRAGVDDYFATIRLQGGVVPAYPSDLVGNATADLMWRNSVSASTYLWDMNGPVLGNDSALSALPVDWLPIGVADFNGDGFNDVVYRNHATGEARVHYLYRSSNGSTLMYLWSSASLFTLPADWIIEGVADFNQDGKPDFLMRNTASGNAFVWYFDNHEAIGDQFLFNIEPVWQVIGVADFNGDNQPDLVFRNSSTGLAFVWNTQFSAGNLSLAGSSPPIFSIDSAWEVVRVADWNADNKPDLVFRNRVTGVVFVWYMDGTTLTTSDFITQIDPSWEIVPKR